MAQDKHPFLANEYRTCGLTAIFVSSIEISSLGSTHMSTPSSPPDAKPVTVKLSRSFLGRLNNSWLFFAVAMFCLYAVWNPWGTSLYLQWMRPTMELPPLVLMTLVVTLLLGGITWGAWRELGAIGTVLLAAVIGVLMWFFAWLGVMDEHTLTRGWFWQPVLAAALTLGFRWSLFWRSITGRQAVYEDDTTS